MEYIGSCYEGERNNGRLEGHGMYYFPTETHYEGELTDGMFHGKGTLFFPKRGKFIGRWEYGVAVEGTYIFADGLEYKEKDWKYCTFADRRYYSEICNGLRPSGRSQVTNLHPPREIFKNHYECKEGFYDPQKRIVFDHNGEFLENADDDYHAWIVENCRKGWDEWVGHPVSTNDPFIKKTQINK